MKMKIVINQKYLLLVGNFILEGVFFSVTVDSEMDTFFRMKRNKNKLRVHPIAENNSNVSGLGRTLLRNGIKKHPIIPENTIPEINNPDNLLFCS